MWLSIAHEPKFVTLLHSFFVVGTQVCFPDVYIFFSFVTYIRTCHNNLMYVSFMSVMWEFIRLWGWFSACWRIRVKCDRIFARKARKRGTQLHTQFRYSKLLPLDAYKWNFRLGENTSVDSILHSIQNPRNILGTIRSHVLDPKAARSKAQVCGRSLPGVAGSNPTGGLDVCCECCVLSSRGLCDELITRPEESYRLWCVVVCDLETS